MNKNKIRKWILFFFVLFLIHSTFVYTDGGYFFSSESVAVSADQRAIIIQNGNEINMTFSTGYTGEGEAFGWIIPVPVPPAIEDINEAGYEGKKAFEMLDAITAPEFYMYIRSGGCFPAGTIVPTEEGPQAIETLKPGSRVSSFDLSSEEWTFAEIIKQGKYFYEEDLVTIQSGAVKLEATGNHLFYVLRGDELSSRPISKEIPEEEQRLTKHGRWVQARDLRTGDMLKSKNEGDIIVTSLSTAQVEIEVYHLEVAGYHNYAVHQSGVLVHNGGQKESAAEIQDEKLVTVHGTVILAHYEVSVIGASDASALMHWLSNNGYQAQEGL
jgi:hypothetical protein